MFLIFQLGKLGRPCWWRAKALREGFLTSSPNHIWEMTKKYSGISEVFFNEYFADREVAHAIKIRKTRKYKKPLSLKENFNVSPPQSYLYLSADAVN